MKIVDLFTNRESNIKISYGVERERHLTDDKTLKKIKKVKVKKNKKKNKK